jgi:hypothetical protein
MQGTLLSLLASLPFAITLRAPFIYDDTSIIRDNVLLRGWGAVWHVWTTPYWPGDATDALGLYRPLQLSLLSLVWNVTGGRAFWFHLYALSLSVAGTLAIWWLLRRMAGDVAALVAAAWFAVHPLHVEVIASIANSSEIVVVLATIGLIWLLLRDDTNEFLRAMLFGLLAASAMAAKESGLLAVPVAAATAWCLFPHKPVGTTRVWTAAAIGVAAILMARLAVLGDPISHASIAAQGLSPGSAGARVLGMMSLWPRIGAMLVFPTALAPYYGPTTFPAGRGFYAFLGIGLFAALCGVIFAAFRNGERRPLAALAWVVLLYIPASNLIVATGQIVSDRVLFGATVGVAMLIAFAIDVAAPVWRRAGLVLVIFTTAISFSRAATYSVAWTSHHALWTWLAEVEPQEHLSYKLLGMDARARGEQVRAIELLSRALGMVPTDRQIRFELGQAFYSAGRYTDAVAVLHPLLRDEDARGEPEFLRLYLESVGRSEGARGIIAAATPLRHSSSATVALLYIGLANEQLGDLAAADSAYAAGLRRAPNDSLLNARLLGVRGATSRAKE